MKIKQLERLIKIAKDFGWEEFSDDDTVSCVHAWCYSLARINERESPIVNGYYDSPYRAIREELDPDVVSYPTTK